MNGVVGLETTDHSEFVEVDPTRRYGRYNEVLGKGASKTVYRAFDEYQGIEVAWNQVKLYDFLRSPENLERLYREIHLLKTLNHRNIMKFHTYWVDTANRIINFVTEMFTSGSLRQYRLKHKRVHIRAVKHWCRQILKGLLYLHSQDPPIIHRDLKCDNIFINGNQGEVKIGDLGLAAILRKSHAAHCVGTPEFMAPEVYAEEYNELVDIYAFGMCILEMVTFEYPYSECTHPAQIYKKVMSGKKPDALYKVEDPEVRCFVGKCLASVSQRLSAEELLNDPFLQIDDYVFGLRPLSYSRESEGIGGVLQPPPMLYHHDSNSAPGNGCSNYLGYEVNDLEYHHIEADEIELFPSQDDEHLEDVDIIIKGRRREDDGIFLRLRIADKEGHVRNIYFPFDIQYDTALSVATEMVAELVITDQDVTKIADMIDGEIASLVPEWQRGFRVEESPNDLNNGYCHNSSSTCSIVDHEIPEKPGAQKLQILQCSREEGCSDVHGRFEEITYQFDGSEQCNKEGTPLGPRQSVDMLYTDIWAQREGPELSSQCSIENHSGDESEPSDQSTLEYDENVKSVKEGHERPYRSTSAAQAVSEDSYENEIRRELRWLKAKYQLQLRELRDEQLGVAPRSPSLYCDCKDQMEDKPAFSPDAAADLKTRNYEADYGSCSPEHMVTAKNFYAGTLLQSSVHRATSLSDPCHILVQGTWTDTFCPESYLLLPPKLFHLCPGPMDQKRE